VVLVALGVLVLLAATGTAKVPVLSAMFHTSTPGPTVSPSPTPIPSPAETVRIYMTAFSNLDIDRMQQLVCGRDAEEMRESMDILEEVVSFSDVTIDVSGLHYELIEEGQDTASVRVTGEMFTLILGEENVEEIDEVTHLVREDGTWKVCGEY
jgi:hypothetical protein